MQNSIHNFLTTRFGSEREYKKNKFPVVAYAFSFVSMILCFYPSFARWSLADDKSSSVSLSRANFSLVYQCSVILSVIFSAAKGIEQAFDRNLPIEKGVTFSYFSWETYAAVMIPNVIALIVVVALDVNHNIVPCLLGAETISFFHSCLIYLHKYGPEVWTLSRTSWWAFAISVINIFTSFMAFDRFKNVTCYSVCLAIHILMFLSVLFSCNRWIRLLTLVSNNRIKKLRALGTSYIITFSVGIFGTLIIKICFLLLDGVSGGGLQ